MRNFLIGLGIGLAGFTATVVFGVLHGLSKYAGTGPATGYSVVMWIGVALIFLGPLYFWLINPLRRRKSTAKP